METNIDTTEKVLLEALELRDKGVSLPTILNTYPEQAAEIQDMFASIAEVSTKKESIRPSMQGLKNILAQLPDVDSAPATAAARTESPYVSFWSTVHLSSWKFVLPVAAIALFVAGGFFVAKKPGARAPIAPSLTDTNGAPATQPTTTTKPLAMNTQPTAGSTSAPKTAAPTAGLRTFAAPSASAPSGSPVDQSLSAFQTSADGESSSQDTIIHSQNDGSLAMADTQYMSDPSATYGAF